HAFTFGVDGNDVSAEVRTEHVAEPRERAAVGRGPPGHWLRYVDDKRERNVGPAHRQPSHDFAHDFGLTAIGFQELQSRGRSKEQITHLDGRPLPERGWFYCRLLTGIDGNAPGMRLACVARGDGQPGGSADGWQRLA